MVEVRKRRRRMKTRPRLHPDSLMSPIVRRRDRTPRDERYEVRAGARELGDDPINRPHHQVTSMGIETCGRIAAHTSGPRAQVRHVCCPSRRSGSGRRPPPARAHFFTKAREIGGRIEGAMRKAIAHRVYNRAWRAKSVTRSRWHEDQYLPEPSRASVATYSRHDHDPQHRHCDRAASSAGTGSSRTHKDGAGGSGLGVVALSRCSSPARATNTQRTAIATAVGTMRGTYQMTADDGHRFDAPIPEFTLSVPRVCSTEHHRPSVFSPRPPPQITMRIARATAISSRIPTSRDSTGRRLRVGAAAAVPVVSVCPACPPPVKPAPARPAMKQRSLPALPAGRLHRATGLRAFVAGCAKVPATSRSGSLARVREHCRRSGGASLL